MSTRKENPFIGKWRVVWMEMWDQGFVDMEVPGHFTFEKDGQGSFQFGLVQGYTDCSVRDDRIEFSWIGSNEMDEASGRGFAQIENGALIGRIFFHQSDDSEFRAIKA